MKKINVGFIGCGNMGGALAKAVAKSETCDILLADMDNEKANALATETGGTVVTVDDIAKTAKYIFLGVKPHGMADLIGEIGIVVNEQGVEKICLTKESFETYLKVNPDLKQDEVLCKNAKSQIEEYFRGERLIFTAGPKSTEIFSA